MKRLFKYLTLSIFITVTSCTGQNQNNTRVDTVPPKADPDNRSNNSPPAQPLIGPVSFQDPSIQISPFVRRIWQDRQGNFWFGTNGDGVIRYNGDSLTYFSFNQGFNGLAVRAILEDQQGNIWFGTEAGISRYTPAASGKAIGNFTNYTQADGLIHNDVWSMITDRKGIIWIGTLQGVSRFNGKTFTTFDLPETKPDYSRGVTSARIAHSIMEDSRGRIWFGTNGGAYIYDPLLGPDSLLNLSVKDGLCHNTVNSILEDDHGNFWFATHHNGVCRWNGKSFTHFTPEDGVHGTEVWSLFKDQDGNIWFPTEGFGIFRYNSSHTAETNEEVFTNFGESDGLISKAIQCIFQDKEGRIWCGGWLGLYRYDPSSTASSALPFVNLTKNVPWN